MNQGFGQAMPARHHRRDGRQASRYLVLISSGGFAVARLLTQWAEVVGPDIAARARPVKMSYGREGLGATLTLLVAGSAAPLVQMDLPRIREKVNACYGYNAVARIVLTQTAAAGLAEPAAAFAHAPPAPAEPAPAIRAAAAEAARDVADGGLRAALEALAQNVLSRQDRMKGPSA